MNSGANRSDELNLGGISTAKYDLTRALIQLHNPTNIMLCIRGKSVCLIQDNHCGNTNKKDLEHIYEKSAKDSWMQKDAYTSTISTIAL